MKKDLPERTKEFALRVIRLCLVLDEKPGVSAASLFPGYDGIVEIYLKGRI